MTKKNKKIEEMGRAITEGIDIDVLEPKHILLPHSNPQQPPGPVQHRRKARPRLGLHQGPCGPFSQRQRSPHRRSPSPRTLMVRPGLLCRFKIDREAHSDPNAGSGGRSDEWEVGRGIGPDGLPRGKREGETERHHCWALE